MQFTVGKERLKSAANKSFQQIQLRHAMRPGTLGTEHLEWGQSSCADIRATASAISNSATSSVRNRLSKCACL